MNFLKEGIKKGVFISVCIILTLTCLGKIDWAIGLFFSSLLGLMNLYILSLSIFNKRVFPTIARLFLLSIIILLFIWIGLSPIALAFGFIIPPIGIAWEGMIKSND